MLPHDQKPWAKSLARVVISGTILGLALLAYYLRTHNSLHIPEIVGIFLLFLAIVPPNLAIIYPWLIPAAHHANHDTRKSTPVR
jgi:hypothetical protein